MPRAQLGINCLERVPFRSELAIRKRDHARKCRALAPCSADHSHAPIDSDLEVHLPGTRARSRRAKITDAQYNRVLKPSKKLLTKVRGKVSVVAPMGEIKHKDSEYN